MGTIYLTAVVSSGGAIAATIERLADGYFREDDAEVFNSGLSYADKNIALTEGSDEDRGTYTATVDGASWDDGLYRFRVHDENDDNVAVTASIFEVDDGNEVPVGQGQADTVYHADIQYARDTDNVTDNYMLTWFKNGVRQSTISSTKINVLNDQGSWYIADQDMTHVGSGIFAYAATGTERQVTGELYFIEASGIIDSAYRKYSWNLGRDL